MASKRQIEANWANATKSTGPKTAAGKARSSRNAYRHGLSRRTDHDDMAPAALTMAIAIQLEGSMDESAAQDLTQARRRLFDIRHVRFKLFLALLEGSEPGQLSNIAGLERYEKTARARQRRGLRRLTMSEK